MTDLEKYMDIKCDQFDPKCCPITLGNSIVCDGHYPGKTTAVFTHFHSDHIKNFSRTIANCSNILLTKTTFDAIKSLKNASLNRANIHPLSYGEKFYTGNGESIELINANHVPGSCQVLVTMLEENNTKILYSGDFSFPNMAVPNCKYLVLAGEHGTPTFDYDTDKANILRRIFDKVYEEIMDGKPVEIRANSGTMQDILSTLESVDGNDIIPAAVPFLMDKKHMNLTNAVSDSYDKQFRLLEVDDNAKLNELYSKKIPYVRFAPVGSRKPQEDRAIIIQADVNQEFAKKGPFFTNDNHRWFACLSAHSSFSNILKYVKKSDAEFILVDGSRTSPRIASSLADSINDKLHKQAIMKPNN